MVDLVNIGMAVDSRQVKEGREELHKFGNEAGKTEKSTKKLSTGLKVMAGAFASFATGALMRTVISNTVEQEKAVAQLDAALKSTGNQVGKTSQELQKLASDMQNVTTYGDEAVISMQSVLLTFTKIGGDTFPRASMAIADVATRMGMDLNSAALQVGKALNDPIQGISALTRSGIQFTDVQKEMIKQMVDTGNVAGAQAMILDELETQFGGSAKAARETLGGAIQSLKNSFGDLLEGSGGNLNDTSKSINDLTALISSNNVKQAFASLTNGVLKLVEWIVKAASAFVDFGKTIGEFFGRLATGIYLVDDAGAKQKTLADRTAEATVKLQESQQAHKAAQEEYNAVNQALKELNARYGEGSDVTAGLRARQEELAARIAQTGEAARVQKEELDKLTASQEKQASAITGGSDSSASAGLSQKEKDRLQNQLEELRTHYASEEELALAAYQERNDKIAELENAKQISDQEALDLKFESQWEYEQKLADMEYAAAQERIKIKEEEARAKQQAENQFWNDITGLMSSNSKTMFEIGKKASIARAVLEGASAAVSAWKAGMSVGGPYAPLVAAAYTAASLAKTASLINSIKSSSYSGGGGVSASGGSVGSVSTGADFNGGAGSATQQPEKPTTKDIRVTFEGDNIHSNAMRKFAEDLGETLRDMGSDANLVAS